jgi:hypothetical protein
MQHLKLSYSLEYKRRKAMDWKFWHKDNIETLNLSSKPKRFGKPKDLPQDVGRYLVVKRGLDPDWVWSLKCVEKPRENAKNTFDFRIFRSTSAAQQGVNVRDYNSLDNHLNLILIAGWYAKDTHGVELEPLIKEAV